MSAAVVGAQYGSEGKGLIVGHLAKQYQWHVRVGAANAGHTLYTNGGQDLIAPGVPERVWEKHVVQQIPCAAYANPEAVLCIGPGAIVNEWILGAELDDLNEWRDQHGMRRSVVWVDERAHVVTKDQAQRESETDLQERIGSTSATAREGVGQCQADKVMRRADCVRARDVFDQDERVFLGNVPDMLQGGNSDRVLLEGTQGTSLSLTTGDFPYVTSRNTTIDGLASECGFPSSLLGRRIIVARTYPIRVAGNSGDFYPDSREISWESIGIDEEDERTTVTKKVRRVATFSMLQMEDAVTLNDPTDIALTFCDYLEPTIYGEGGNWDYRTLKAYPKVNALVETIQDVVERPVTMLGTGPHSVINLKRS